MAAIPPNTFPHGYQIAYSVVSGGHAGDPAPDQSGTCRVFDPIRHGPNVDEYQLPFITMLGSPTQAAVEETRFPPEPGQMVATSFNMGDPTSRSMVGMPNNTNNSEAGGLPGNSLGSKVARAAALNTLKYMPTKYKEKMDRGALVRAIEEELGNWTHSRTKGLPTHAALYPMAGQVLPALKQIDTAVKSFAGILNFDSIAQLPGMAMNLASLFNKMNKKQKKKLTENKSQAFVDALESMMALIVEGEGSTYYITSGRVHEETFIENAVELISQCSEIGDLVECLQRLRYDESLHGLDKLQDIEIKANTGFGEMVMTVDRNGNAKQNEKSLQQILSMIQKFVGLLNSVQAGGQGKTMFGEDASKVMDALSRLPPTASAKRTEIINASEQARAAVRAVAHGQLLGGGIAAAIGLIKGGGG